jgi:hypothetical protein
LFRSYGQGQKKLEGGVAHGSAPPNPVLQLFRAWEVFSEVTHHLLKGGEDIVFVGFPLTSLDRYTPQGATVSPSDDKSIVMTLPTDVLKIGFVLWPQR